MGKYEYKFLRKLFKEQSLKDITLLKVNITNYYTFLNLKLMIIETRGGGENALIGQNFGTPPSIVALISIQHGNIFRFIKKCVFTPYQWPCFD